MQIISLIQRIYSRLSETNSRIPGEVTQLFHFLNNETEVIQERVLSLSTEEVLEISSSLETILDLLRAPKSIASSSDTYLLVFTSINLVFVFIDSFSGYKKRLLQKIQTNLRNYSLFILRENEKKLEGVRNSLAREIEARKKLDKEYQLAFQKAQQQLQDTNNLLATESANKLVLEYGTAAENEKKRSRDLFGAGIGVIFAGILAVTILFSDCFHKLTTSLSWEHFLFKASVFIMFLIPAIYILKESAKREEHFFKLRDLSLKIRTIPSYLKDIPSYPADRLSEKDKLRLDLARMIFGQTTTTPDIKNQENTIQELLDLLKIAIQGK